MRVPVKTVAMLLPVLRSPARSRSSQPLRSGAGSSAGAGSGVGSGVGSSGEGIAADAGDAGVSAGAGAGFYLKKLNIVGSGRRSELPHDRTTI